jgi:hypothetical protein
MQPRSATDGDLIVSRVSLEGTLGTMSTLDRAVWTANQVKTVKLSGKIPHRESGKFWIAFSDVGNLEASRLLENMRTDGACVGEMPTIRPIPRQKYHAKRPSTRFRGDEGVGFSEESASYAAARGEVLGPSVPDDRRFWKFHPNTIPRVRQQLAIDYPSSRFARA